MNGLTVDMMKKQMAQAMVAESPDDGTADFPTYTDKLVRDMENKQKVIDYITRWSNAAAVNGTQPFANLYKKHKEAGQLQQLEDLGKHLGDIRR